MSFIKAKEHLENNIIEFKVASATVSLVAKALNCSEAKLLNLWDL